MARSEEAKDLDAPGKAELAIVAAGARTDLGQLDAAVAELEIPQLDINRAFSYSPRLFRAYAEALAAVGRTAEAEKWQRQAAVAENALGLDVSRGPGHHRPRLGRGRGSPRGSAAAAGASPSRAASGARSTSEQRRRQHAAAVEASAGNRAGTPRTMAHPTTSNRTTGSPTMPSPTTTPWKRTMDRPRPPATTADDARSSRRIRPRRETTPSGRDAGRLIGDGAPLISPFDALLADLDGVVYAGPHAIPGAVESLRRLAGIGVGLGYVTNNASRTPAQVAAHLRELGAPAEDHQVVSSSQAAGELLATLLPAGAAGAGHRRPALAQEVELVGLVPVHGARSSRRRGAGVQPGVGWKDLAEAAYVIAGGALWVATNTDMSIPQARGMAPGNGTLVAAVAAATGQRPLVAGKPEAPLFHAAAKRLAADRPLVVGDRLDTDILGGNSAGFATVAVLTGVDTRETILAARTASAGYLINDLTDLYRPYPAIESDAGRHRCGAATAVVHGQTVRVSGDPGDLDAWRAACAAWWTANPETDTAPGAGARMAGSLDWGP